jgi:hypothetical protein
MVNKTEVNPMLRRLGQGLIVLLGLGLVLVLVALQVQATEIQSLAQALDANHNGYLDDPEILQAVQYWVTSEPVPGTGGHVISDAEILELIAMWIEHTPIAPPPPPPVARVCRESLSGRVLTVPSQYSTIQQAVNNAKEGDTILVKPGTYEGGITISKSLVLEGQEGSTLTKIQGGPNTIGISILNAKDVVIRGFTITGSQIGVSIGNSSSVCLEQNDISNNLGPGISATTVSQAVAAYPRGLIIANNRITGNVGFGISANDILQLDIIGNEILNTATKPDGTAGQGIALLGGSKVQIKRNRIARAREFGLFAKGVTELVIEGNEISEIPDVPGTKLGTAIALQEGTTASEVRANTITESDIAISVEKGTAIRLVENRISGSKVNGLLISKSIQVELALNEIRETLPRSLEREDYAIPLQIREGSTVTARGNEIVAALGYAVLIESGSDMILKENRISRVQGKPGIPGRGIGVDGARAEIERNNITNNAGDGIAVLDRGSAEISTNWIANNQGFGIFATPDAHIICPEGNQLVENKEDLSEGVPQECLGSVSLPPLPLGG